MSDQKSEEIRLSDLTTAELEGLIARLPPEDALLEAALCEYDRRTPLDTAALRAGLKAKLGLDGKEGRGKPPVVKLLVLIAAAMALAGTALAALSHGAMFNALFGPGIVSAEGGEPITVEPSEFSYTDGDQVITYMLPGYELTEPDEETARRLLEPYVIDLGQRYVVDGYTITLISYLRDEAGTDRLYYSIENPEGLDNMSVSEFNGYTYADPKNDRPGLNSIGYVDTARSTDTKLYICVPGVAFRAEDYIEEYAIYGERNPDSDVYIPPVTRVTIDAPALVPAVTAQGAHYAVALSPMGLKVTKTAPVEGDPPPDETDPCGITWEYLDPRYVSILFSDGEELVVQERDKTNNTTYVCAYNASWIFCLNRLVDPARVAAVIVDGEEIPLG